jgi:NAD(P)-dependent dehydrogenase (short-subunit alcohol dehydrogenase family)
MSTVLITGANRGIGLGLVKAYLNRDWKVIATCRNPQNAKQLQALSKSDDLTVIGLSVDEPECIEKVAVELKETCIDLLINNAGVGGGTSQSLSEVDVENWLQVLKVNTVSPLLVTRAFLPNLRLSRAGQVMVVSSQLGAISYNNIGLYPYESSKAAVNKVVRGLSIDLKPEGISVCALHPGWVKTDMGGPNAEITVDEAVSGLVNTIEQLNLSKTGTFWQWDGSEHPW